MNPTLDIQALQDAGAHFGHPRARRNPSAAPFIYATKDRTDIFDLEETIRRLETAKQFVNSLAQAGRPLLFVGGKNEASSIVKDAAMKVGAPYVAGRWIGGSLTNFKNIRKRIELMEKLVADRDSGELDKKYTKHERLQISRKIEGLETRFGGVAQMMDLPGALFVVDSRFEDTAVKEAVQLNIPVIGLSSSDCNFKFIAYPIPANDTSVKSISAIVHDIADAYAEGRKAPVRV